MGLRTAKGMKDIMPSEMMIYENVIDVIKQKFRSYGYLPLSTPAIELFEILSAKFAAGESSDALKETFKLSDQGNRELGLRFDLTVPLARVIAMNKDLKMPFKRYQIAPVWRDGPVSTNRYREFMQCDVDVVGCKDVTADAELLLLISDIYSTLNLDYIIILNSRKLLKGLIMLANIPEQLINEVIISIDKFDKIGESGVITELKGKDIDSSSIDKLMMMFGNFMDMSNTELLLYLQQLCDNGQGNDMLAEGVKEVYTILKYLDGYDLKLQVSPSLSRGLSYYTGPVYEVSLQNSTVKSSIGGGGRYDDMIGDYIGGKDKVPAAGFSLGLSRIVDAIKIKQTETFSYVKLHVVPIKTFQESLKICQQFRSKGIATSIDLKGKGLSKNLTYADSLGIPYVVLVGEEELKQNKVKLKNLKTGKETLLTVEQVINELKK